jgi:hypothetical protein
MAGGPRTGSALSVARLAHLLTDLDPTMQLIPTASGDLAIYAADGGYIGFIDMRAGLLEREDQDLADDEEPDDEDDEEEDDDEDDDAGDDAESAAQEPVTTNDPVLAERLRMFVEDAGK